MKKMALPKAPAKNGISFRKAKWTVVGVFEINPQPSRILADKLFSGCRRQRLDSSARFSATSKAAISCGHHTRPLNHVKQTGQKGALPPPSAFGHGRVTQIVCVFSSLRQEMHCKTQSICYNCRL